MRLSDGYRKLVADTVVELIRREGVCAPGALVAEARPKSSDLHELFEWDDGVAGEQYRRVQAGHLIRAVRVEVQPGARVKEAPRFVSVTVLDRGRGYVETDAAVREVELRDQMLVDAHRQLLALRRRYAVLKELAEVWASIDALEVDS